ncbi:hypothetical protein K493DRAFT_297365 [Basidiobolus meristosporus CBS 931.73]|uniref:Knr4/Smi1-like domain-containing protein n=1 Tax=Basidiobolus meristosporus CBS 931.73 TaxID=1314790 RepID=A0A1Y1Z1A9_9FUNG|nr:hypothetical protein K493DRAFT_297365 [Basidiobolus meristosporus CBS 931.73]|eukprot:ORY03615.1 hypothetical protein K493DRAFT_297365 [Basidiobolus meristosporus CBS 931.73]
MPARTLDKIIEEARSLEQRLYFEDIYFEPSLEESVVVEFERDNLVRLPESYRAYLIHIGNGSSMTYGQAEGILPLDEAPHRYPVSQPELRTLMSLPFPFRRDGSCQVPLDSPELNQGHLVIGYDDYETFYLLIIEGACRGEIWQRNLDLGFVQCANRADFFPWLEDRLLSLKNRLLSSSSAEEEEYNWEPEEAGSEDEIKEE